ncbi:hypothetical protein LCGC14_1064340 [marine sediment metagenome]|uniref:Uncharacterized protein n=2 Tax=root TaxID=1 RepID=A0A831QU11_9FLAO|nr:hypothetical protein [Pricia antarctica]
MLITKETQNALNKFAREVVMQSRKNLNDLDKNTSCKLDKSIDFNLNISKNSFGLDFEMEDYGQFQDKGVSGFIKKYDTPFTYRDNRPPPNKLDSWIVRRGIAPRDKNGKFISRKSLQFLISRKIFFYGIKPSLFFTKPFEKEFKKLPNTVVEAFGLDVEKFFKNTLEKPVKPKK